MEVMGQKLPIVMNMINGQCTLDSPMQGATDIPATVLLLTKDSIKISVESLGANYVARYVDGQLKGTFSQHGMQIPLNMKEISPAGPNRPQTPKGPFPYTTEEVTFTNAKAGPFLQRVRRRRTPCELVVANGQQPLVHPVRLFRQYVGNLFIHVYFSLSKTLAGCPRHFRFTSPRIP